MYPQLTADYRWCRATLHHYENFQVVSWFVPRSLRPDFWAVYAYCRTVDDIGDESTGADGDSADGRLQRLDQFEAALTAALSGTPRGPLFRALANTVAARGLPAEPFYALIAANRQDQTVTTYATFDDVLAYCASSANPVGQLVLALFGLLTADRQVRSDALCTALQLTNFWQDLRQDLGRGRCYVPLDALADAGASREMLTDNPADWRVRRALAHLRERTWQLFSVGAELEALVPRRLRLQLRLYRLGGEAVLRRLDDAAEPHVRPRLDSKDRLRIAWRALTGFAP